MVINPDVAGHFTGVPPMVIEAGSSRKHRSPAESTGVPMFRHSDVPSPQPDASNTLPVT